MNRINPKALLHSKWSKVDVRNKEKHFIITLVKFDEQQKVIECLIEALMTKNESSIPMLLQDALSGASSDSRTRRNIKMQESARR